MEKAYQMLEKNESMTKSLISRTVYQNNSDGFCLLLVLIFFMGYNGENDMDSSRYEENVLDTVRFQPTNNRYA
jgi:hypothetical protein